MPRTKQTTTGNEPANKQKGEKVCNFCHEKKKLTDFYISKSPLFSVDERVPICKDCVISASLNEDGTINDIELNKILKKIYSTPRPLFIYSCMHATTPTP